MPAPVDAKSAEACESCHPVIVSEWRESMHARSTAKADPIYALVRGMADETLGDKAKACQGCHYASASAPDELADAGDVGVTCAVCHRLADGHPSATLASGRHSELAREHEGDRSAQGVCLSCHAELRTGAGVPVCTTGEETALAKAGPCIDCHMAASPGAPSTSKKVETHRSHRFPGGHVPDFLRAAATIGVARINKEVVVNVTHAKAGHAVPTGNPLRFLVARVEQLDASGAVIWTNIEGDAMPPLDSGAVFMKVFASADGKKPVPPFRSSGPPTDSRLAPGADKELRYPLAEKAAKVRAVLEYHLAPRAILDGAKLSTEPAIMDRRELEL